MIIPLMDNPRVGCSSAAKLTYHSLVKSQRDLTSNAKKRLLYDINLDKSMSLEEF